MAPLFLYLLEGIAGKPEWVILLRIENIHPL